MVIQIPKRNHVQCINDQGCIIISDKMCIKTMREIEFIRFNVSNHVVTRGIRFTTKPCYLLLVSILWLFHKFHSNNQIASILPFNLSSKIKYSFLIIKWQRPIQSLFSFCVADGASFTNIISNRYAISNFLIQFLSSDSSPFQFVISPPLKISPAIYILKQHVGNSNKL